MSSGELVCAVSGCCGREGVMAWVSWLAVPCPTHETDDAKIPDVLHSSADCNKCCQNDIQIVGHIVQWITSSVREIWPNPATLRVFICILFLRESPVNV